LELSEIKLLAEIKNNSETAFDQLFRMYYKNLVHFAIKITKNRENAEEVVQELFVQFWTKRHQLELNISIKSYLYRAVFNNCVHFNKRQNRYEKTDISAAFDLGNDFENLLEQTELEVKIYQLIDQLPAECRKVFKLSRFEELKNKEIAEKLEISIKTVETQMTRALKFLRLNLADYFKILIFLILELRT